MRNCRRREFLIVSGALLIAPPGSLAQPAEKVRRIAILEPGNKTMRADLWGVLETRLRELGYVEGKNLTIERRWADGVDARLPHLAQELLAGNPEVVVAITTPAIQALMRLSKEVPIVMTGVADPVASRLVASLARPGGNVTGMSLDLSSVVRKRLELMREVVPNARRVGLLGPGTNAGVQAALKQAQDAGRALGIDVQLVEASNAPTIARAFEKLATDPLDALLVSQVMLQYFQLVVDLAARVRIPAGYVDRVFLDAGGLLVFGPDREEPYRHAADYVRNILQGAKPANMPVIQPREFWMGVNLQTAKALGLKIPYSILLRADRVIE